jgi:GTPase
MVDQAKSAVQDVDVIVVVVDSSSRPDALDQSLAELLGSQSLKETPVILCLNKMDRLRAEHVQAHVELYCQLFRTEKYMLTRATTGDNLAKLGGLIVGELPEQPPLFGDEDFTDQSARFLVSELIREKVLLKSRQEIPYATAVLIEQWEEEPNLLRIGASLLVERASQKGILIGKHGAFIKAVGQEARAEIEALLGRHVYLDLHVGVRENWRMSPRVLRELEYME